MTTVRVEAPARLHMGMLDASGDGDRAGSAGSGWPCAARRRSSRRAASDELTVEGPDARARAGRGASACREALGDVPGARVRVLEAIPPHVGLGSGTKLALAVTAALCALAGRSPDPAAMARTAGRGARSAVGLWTFALGGLVVEGGRRRGIDEPAPLLVAPRDAGRVALRARDPGGRAGALGRRGGGGVRGPAARPRALGADRAGRADRAAARRSSSATSPSSAPH